MRSPISQDALLLSKRTILFGQPDQFDVATSSDETSFCVRRSHSVRRDRWLVECVANFSDYHRVFIESSDYNDALQTAHVS
ncbi:MAG TPA: hypothetical protein V6C78_00185, partial [Crinalium sp.]